MVSSIAVQAELKTLSDSVEDITNTIFTSNTSTPIKIDKCYIKFLKQHNLTQIIEPVTLKNFIQHLHLNNFSNSFKISINFKKTESHIYLKITDQILPNHTKIDSSLFNTYGHLPLLTSFNWSIPNTNSTDLFTSNQPIYPNTTTTIPSIPSLITPEHTAIPIKIGSVNINGLSQPNKKLSLIELLQENNFEIFGLSETHLSSKEGKILNSQIQNYTSFWSSYTNPYQAGVGIFVYKKISKYIAKSYDYNVT